MSSIRIKLLKTIKKEQYSRHLNEETIEEMPSRINIFIQNYCQITELEFASGFMINVGSPFSCIKYHHFYWMLCLRLIIRMPTYSLLGKNEENESIKGVFINHEA